jgi:hypothetical protein
MYALRAVCDGNVFNLEQAIPIKEKYETIVTFTRPVKKSQKGLLKYAGTWDNDDVEMALEMMKERENFAGENVEI